MILTKATDKEVKAETISRIKTLIDKYNLNPNVLKYFRKGQVYYSYLTAMGMMGSIDTISYDEDYEKAVKDFEVHHKGYVVYHAIESITPQGKMLALLYTGDDKENWDCERLEDNYLMAYVVNFTVPEYSEFGDIFIEGFGDSGALVRVDVGECINMKLEMYGHYYRMFKGTGGVPTKVTVVGIEGDTVTLVRGHYTKEDFEERSEDLDEAIRLFCLTKMKCNKDKILTSLTPKQQRLVEKEDKEIEVMIMQADYALEKFKNGGSETMSGTVKWFNTQKGYGFITGDDGAEYFAHQTQIKMDGFRTLDAGDIVEFDVRSEEKGLAAVNIVPVLTLSMMKKKAAKEHLHLDVAPADGSGNANWMIVDGNNFEEYINDMANMQSIAVPDFSDVTASVVGQLEGKGMGNVTVEYNQPVTFNSVDKNDIPQMEEFLKRAREDTTKYIVKELRKGGMQIRR